jgi:chromosome segregation ATPase
MAGQMNELLGDVARQLDKLDARYVELIQEVAALKAEKEWAGEDRRKVDKRLETGDHTFEAIRAETKEADRIARSALDIADKALKSCNRAWSALQPLLDRRPDTTIRRKWRDAIIEHGVKAALGIGLLALYHILVHGPAIARALKAAHGGE